MRTSGQVKGIFCLEGLWNPDLRKPSTVRPILELLRIQEGIEYIYRDCVTKEEFEYYLKKWVQRAYDAFPILYLATHGETFSLCLGEHECTLDEVASLLEGKCENRLVLCGSCSTLGVDKRHLKRFLGRSGALAICGYRLDVDWLRSTAFELLLMAEMQGNEFSRRGILAIEAKLLEVARLFSELEFRIVTCKELA
jgi:hypothetical protein